MLGSQGFVGIPGFDRSPGNLNSGPLGFTASALPTSHLHGPVPSVSPWVLEIEQRASWAWQALYLISYFPGTPPLFLLLLGEKAFSELRTKGIC